MSSIYKAPRVGDIFKTVRDSVGDTGQSLVPCDGNEVNVDSSDRNVISVTATDHTSLTHINNYGARGLYISEDGQYIGVNTNAQNHHYYSNDGGQTFNYYAIPSTYTGGWRGMDCSEDGTKCYAAGNSGKLARFDRSNIAGTITAKTVAGSSPSLLIACDATGEVVVFPTQLGSYVYISTDYGENFTQKSMPAKSDYGFVVKGNKDIILVVCQESGLHVSHDRGSTFTYVDTSSIHTNSPNNLNGTWDGSILTLSTGGKHAISTDFGLTWTEVQVAGSSARINYISANGSHIVVWDDTANCHFISVDGGTTYHSYQNPSLQAKPSWFYSKAAAKANRVAVCGGDASGDLVSVMDYTVTTDKAYPELSYLDTRTYSRTQYAFDYTDGPVTLSESNLAVYMEVEADSAHTKQFTVEDIGDGLVIEMEFVGGPTDLFYVASNADSTGMIWSNASGFLLGSDGRYHTAQNGGPTNPFSAYSFRIGDLVALKYTHTDTSIELFINGVSKGKVDYSSYTATPNFAVGTASDVDVTAQGNYVRIRTNDSRDKHDYGFLKFGADMPNYEPDMKMVAESA